VLPPSSPFLSTRSSRSVRGAAEPVTAAITHFPPVGFDKRSVFSKLQLNEMTLKTLLGAFVSIPTVSSQVRCHTVCPLTHLQPPSIAR
jgi:hypothetical protein